MNKWIVTTGNIFFLILTFFFGSSVFAHSPHDVIYDIVLSPKFSMDKTVFIISSNTLMISTDEGYSWKKVVNGLDNVGQLTSIVISPAFDKDGIMLVTSESDGIYCSQDGGKSWQKANRGLENLNIQSIRLSPSFPESEKAVAVDRIGRLYQSTDSGRTWGLLKHDLKEKITYITYVVSGENERLVAGTESGRILISRNGIHQWDTIPGTVDCDSITSISVSPNFNEDGKIWVGSESCGVFEVDIREKSWQAINRGLSDKNITSLLAKKDADGQIVLYASSWQEGLFQLNNNEKVWVKKVRGLTTDPQARDPRYRMPNFKGIAAEKNILFLGGFDGLFKSVDGGRTWEQLDTILLSIITGMDLYAQNDSKNHYLALITYGAGAYLFDVENRKWSIINRGLDWTRLNDIVFSPNYFKDGFIFSGSENNFLRFDKENDLWERIPVRFSFRKRLIKKIIYYSRKVGAKKWVHKFFDPILSDTRFPSVIGPSPDFTNDKTLFFGTRSSGLYVSEDSGKSNSMLWKADEKLITSLCFSPNSTIDGILFVGLYDTGIFKSSDKGKSWSKIDFGIQVQKQVRLAISPNFAKDQTLVAGTASGLFVSIDGGNTWNATGVKELGPTPNVICLSVSPALNEDGIFLVGIKGKGLWITENGGKSFSPFGREIIENNHQAKFIKFSDNFKKDGTIYCASSYKLFRTMDRGKSWHTIDRPIRYENFREELRYTGCWQIIKDDQYSAMNASFSKTPGSRMRLYFVGTGISWIGNKSPMHGQAKIYMDGSLVKIVSQASKIEQKSVKIFSITGLKEQSHEMKIEVFSSQDQTECGVVSIDAIDIIPCSHVGNLSKVVK